MAPWMAFVLTLSLIILVHEWGHFFMARRIGVKVERFSFGFGPQLARFKRGGTEYCVCLLPFGGYVKLAGEAAEGSPTAAKRWEYRGRSVWERIAIVLAGPVINYVLGFVLFFLVFLVGAPVVTTEVGRLLEGFPAEQAGLQVGDKILSVNGSQVTSWEEMARRIRAQEDLVTLSILREGEEMIQVLKPRLTERKNLFGATVHTAQIGIVPAGEIQTQRYPPGEALLMSGRRVWFITHITLQVLWQIATGGISIKEVTGPVGIFHITAAVAPEGLLPLLHLIAFLSVSIGLFNLLPIPVLDGGHIFFLLIEKIRGREVSIRVQENFVRVGLALLLLLVLVVTYNDLIRFNVFERIMKFFGR